MTTIQRQQIGPRLSQPFAYGATVYLGGPAAHDLSADASGSLTLATSAATALLLIGFAAQGRQLQVVET